MLAGFEEPTAGRILLDGQDLRGIPPYRRPVNMMFQSYALFPHMTVEQNIAFGLKQEGMPKAEIEAARRRDAASWCKLTQFAKRKPHQLSGGQRQRVALARSVAKRPEGAAARRAARRARQEAARGDAVRADGSAAGLGLTFVVVTHDQEEAMTMADRIAIMDKGEVMQVATPAEIYEAPASRFVADFVGNVNMFEGTVAAREANTARIKARAAPQSPSRTPAMPRPATRSPSPSGRKRSRCRRSRPEGAANAMEGEVFDLAYLGDMTVYHVKLASGQVVKASSLNALALDRGPADLERPRLDFLRAGRRRRADAVGRLSWPTPPSPPPTAAAAAAPVTPRRSVKAVTSRLVIIVPYLWLLFFFLVPFVIVFKISLSQTAIAMPPYTPVFGVDEASGTAHQPAQLRQLCLADRGRALFQRLCLQRGHRRDLDLPDAAGRLSDRLWHGARAARPYARHC